MASNGLDESNDPFFQIGDDVTAASFPDNGRAIFEISASTTINDAFHALVKENVLSAPVYDAKNNKYLGFLDVSDILALAYGVDMLMSIIPESMMDVEASKRAKDEASSIVVGSLFESDGSTLSTKWCPVLPDTPLKKILLLLASETRRVPVLDPFTGRVTKIISQSSVVSEFYHHIQAAGSKAPASLMKTPRVTGIGAKKVVSIQDSQPAKAAFAEIIDKRISAVAVVDGEGHLLTCISTKDIRLLPVVEQSAISLGHKSVMDMPARLYVSTIRRVTEKTGQARPSVICAGLDTPLKLIIGKLAEARVHRVFIVDTSDKPVGVVSVSDICALLVKQQKWT